MARSVEERVEELLGRMTLREKIGQMNQVYCGWNSYKVVEGEVVLEPEFEKDLRAGMVGAVYGMHRGNAVEGGKERLVTPEEGARVVAHIQRIAVEETRLGIPLLVSEECPKGYMAAGATVFPAPLLYASSWEPELVEAIGRAAAAEVRAGGGNVGYGPILDVPHDPRWSRFEECMSEDPYLNGVLGAAMVRGMQGERLDAETSVISTLKHFAAYGTTEGGRNTAPAHMGERELRETHLPPFEAAVKAGAESVMCSYNEIDGVPVSSDERLLTGILRGEWGFRGFVVSDALAIDELCVGNAENAKHRIAADLAEAAAWAAKAGVDLSLWDKAYLHLEEAVRRGLVSEEVIDRSVRRILRAKVLLGLFENWRPDPGRAQAVMGSHRELSLEAARRSLVLLKNGGVLPLRRDLRLAVVGPNGHNLANMLGTYTIFTGEGVTVYEGLRDLAEDPSRVRFALGCRVKDPSPRYLDEAVALARESDVVVAVVGGSSSQAEKVVLNPAGQIDPEFASQMNDIDNGENIDRHELSLAGIQNELLRRLKGTGRPLVVVLVQGRPYELGWVKENADAVLCAWYPGPWGGRAVAEVLYGLVNPSGRLTVSFPKHTGQIPVNYNHRPTAEKRYLNLDTKPLWPFGYGLSYTEFRYDPPEVEPEEGPVDGRFTVRVRVTNTGGRRGAEVVQLYLDDEVASVTRPVKRLRGFRKVELDAGESAVVEFVLGPEDFGLWDRSMRFTVEPGWFTVLVGPDSERLLSCRLRVR